MLDEEKGKMNDIKRHKTFSYKNKLNSDLLGRFEIGFFAPRSIICTTFDIN